MTRSQWPRSIVLFLLTFSVSGVAVQTKPPTEESELVAAQQLYWAGNFAAAEAAYQNLVKANPKLIPAQVGLIRCFLREEKVDGAYEIATSALAGAPNSPAVLAAMGNVRFRRAEMQDAERAYLKALQLDPKEVRAYLGLAEIYRAYSLYRHAHDVLVKAHEIAPNDPEVQRAYFGQLTRKQRIAAIEAYLSGPHPDDSEDSESLHRYLDFLKETADKPVHSCKLTSKVEQTETRLDAMYSTPQHTRAYGLAVKLNGHGQHLLLDTGASGILLGRKVAEKAGVVRISADRFGGVGDKGLQSGYMGAVDAVRIGDLEFHDCIVRVTDRPGVIEEDGLIGADVFSSYLVDIDIPGGKLKLSPLPKRPDDVTAPTALNTEAEAPATPDESTGAKENPDEQSGAANNTNNADAAKSKPSAPPLAAPLPKDRYIAPEMASWTKVFRFGHQLLIPTLVNESPPLLFLIDTGSFANLLSVRAARQVTRVADSSMQIRGLSGQVNKVYSGEHATLTFSHFRQNNQQIVTIDLSALCRHTGTEISGILGFNVLRLLEIKIDYRDGLVDFVHPNIPPPRD